MPRLQRAAIGHLLLLHLAYLPPLTTRNSEEPKAAGTLNVLWMFGTLVAFLVIPLVWQLFGHLPAFVLGAVILAASGVATALYDRPGVSGTKPRQHSGFQPLSSLEFWKYLIAQTLWWLGFEAIASFFTPFMLHVLGGTVFDAALSMSIFSVAAMGVSVIFGRLYRQHDARVLLGAVLALFVLTALFGLLIHTVIQVFAMLFFAGISWGGIQVISYPLAVDTLREDLARRKGVAGDRAGEETAALHGSVYGVVNLVQALGLMIAAPLAGEAIGLTGGDYRTIFVVSALSMVLALGFVASLRRMPAAGAAPHVAVSEEQ